MVLCFLTLRGERRGGRGLAEGARRGAEGAEFFYKGISVRRESGLWSGSFMDGWILKGRSIVGVIRGEISSRDTEGVEFFLYGQSLAVIFYRRAFS